jgi:hypothetical protein
MPCFVSCAGCPANAGFFFDDLLGECSLHNTRKRVLFHSLENFWNAILSMTKSGLELDSSFKTDSGSIDPSMRPSCKAMKRFPLEALALMTAVRA